MELFQKANRFEYDMRNFTMSVCKHRHTIAHRIAVIASVTFMLVGGIAQSQHTSNRKSSKQAPIEPQQSTGSVGAQACRTCHNEKVNTYLETSHHLTSSLPSKASIHGSFAPG